MPSADEHSHVGQTLTEAEWLEKDLRWGVEKGLHGRTITLRDWSLNKGCQDFTEGGGKLN